MAEHQSTTLRLKPKKDMFLKVLRERGTVAEAARAIGIDRSTAYGWRDKDDAFRSEWADLFEATTDLLEQTLVEAALTGFTETKTVDNGVGPVEVTTTHRRDLNSAKFLLGARRRHIYGQKAEVEHSGTVTTKRIIWTGDSTPTETPEPLDEA